MDEHVCNVIQRLTPAEVSFVQRRVRSVVQSLLKVQEKDLTQPQVRSKMIYNEYGILDEFVLCKIFSAGYSRSTHGRRWWYGGEEDIKSNNNLIPNRGIDDTIDLSECSIWQRSWKEFDSRRERRQSSISTNFNLKEDNIQPAVHSNPISANNGDCPSDEE